MGTQGIQRRSQEQQQVAENVVPLRMLMTIGPETISSVRVDGWEEIELAVDSGASETVIGPDMAQSADMRQGDAYRQGIKYEVANGVRIPNLGEKRFVGVSQEGLQRHMKAQVCDVNKGLLSVSKIVEKGNRVVFDPKGSYIEDGVAREKMYLRAERGLYMLRLCTHVACIPCV